jgi:hypothetical protein
LKKKKFLLNCNKFSKVILNSSISDKRQELIDNLANLDPEIEELYLNEKPIDEITLKRAIRR